MTSLLAPPEPPSVRRARIACTLVVAVAALVAALAAGYLVGLRSAEAEEVRTRRAVCLLLDDLGTDSGSAADAYTCSTEPTR